MEVAADGKESYHDFVFIIMIIGDTPRNHDNFGAHDNPRLPWPRGALAGTTPHRRPVVGRALRRSSGAWPSPRARPRRRLSRHRSRRGGAARGVDPRRERSRVLARGEGEQLGARRVEARGEEAHPGAAMLAVKRRSSEACRVPRAGAARGGDARGEEAQRGASMLTTRRRG